MKDLNFFSIYQGKGKYKEKKDFKSYAKTILIIAGIVIFSHIMYCIVNIIVSQRQINIYNEKLNSEEVKTKKAAADTVNDKIKLLDDYEKSLDNVVMAVKANKLVDDQMLINIAKSVPSDISFSEWKGDNYELTMKGSSKTRSAIAELEHNLKELPNFKQVHVDKIKNGEKVGDDYTFEITTILKEVN